VIEVPFGEFAILVATFRRKISDFGIVADEVRKAIPAGAAGKGCLRA
jgi:hypothetical protein